MTRANLGFAARVLGTVAVFSYLLTRIPLQSLTASFSSLPISRLLVAFGLVLLAAFIAFVRWRALLRGYGAKTLPTYRDSLCIFGGALFYNLLPGAIGGDAYRGYTTRHCFADGAVTPSVVVVLIDRVLGLFGLFALIALTWLFTGRPDLTFLACACLGLSAAASAVLGVSLARHLAPRLRGPLQTWARQLPKLEHRGLLVLAAALSVLTHTLLSMAGYVLIRNFDPRIDVTDALVTFPLGTLASYFPLTVAGAGARDGALAFLFGKLGVAGPGVLTVSLCLLGCDLTVAMLGGLLHTIGARVNARNRESWPVDAAAPAPVTAPLGSTEAWPD